MTPATEPPLPSTRPDDRADAAGAARAGGVARRWKIFLAVAAVATLLDQLSKLWARRALSEGARVPFLDGFWDWRLSFNPGASFNLFEHVGGGRVILSVVALIALGGIGVIVARSRDDRPAAALALGLIAGGALGNLIDRVLSGVVTDFALWHWHESAFWPMFNLADAALVVGVALMLIAPAGPPRPRAPGAAGPHGAAGPPGAR